MKVAVPLLVALAALVAAVAASASSTPGFAGCNSFVKSTAKLAVRPASIVAACADANFMFVKLKWSSWGDTTAKATGTASINTCTPNCAAGKFYRYPARVTLSMARSCSDRREFTKLAWTFTSAAPNGWKRSDALQFRCR